MWNGGLSRDASLRLPVVVGLFCLCLFDGAGPAAGGQGLSAFEVTWRSIRSTLDKGRYDEAERQARNLVSSLENAQLGASVDTARAKNLLIEALSLNGRGAEASSLAAAQQVVGEEELQLGVGDPLLAAGLRNLGDVLFQAGEYERATKAHERALAVVERVPGLDPPELAEYLDHLARGLTWSGRYDEASRALVRSLEIKLSRLAPSDVGIARTLEGIGWLLHRKGEYRQARPRLEQAMQIWETTDPKNPGIVATLNTFGDQFWFEGNAHKARELYLRALAIGEETLRPDHPDIALCLRNVATADRELGNLAEARSRQELAAEIAERSLGGANPQLAGYLNNLANTNMDQGDYASARALYERAMKIREDRLGRDHVDVATIVHNLALAHAQMGDYAESRRLNDRAVATWQRRLGPQHPYVGRALSELAAVLGQQGLDSQARVLLERALAIRERSLVADHPDLARTLTELARTDARLGQTSRAEQLSTRALEIWERAKTPESADVATTLAVHASLRAAKGDYVSARDGYERALDIRRQTVGPSHPDFAAAEANLAGVLARIGAPLAMTYALQAEDIGRTHLRSTLRYMPERESLAYAAKRPKGLDLAISLSAAEQDTSSVFHALIRGRSLILDEMAARRHSVSNMAAPEVAPLWRALVSAQQRLANLVVRGPSDDHPEQYVALVEEARREKELAERALADKSATFRGELARGEIGLEEVRAALPAQSTLVAFILYDRTPLAGSAPTAVQVSSTTSRFSQRSVRSYAAFVISAAKPGVSMVPLGSASSVDALVSRWRNEATSVLDAASPGEAERAYRAAGAALRHRMWDPIVPYLSDARIAFVVPDGTLNLVSFAALPASRTKYLIDEGPAIHYLSAERDLVTKPATKNANSGLLALGGAAFDDATLFTSAAGTPRLKKGESANPTASSSRVRASCGDLASMRFEPLAGTGAEVQEVARLWTESPAKVLRGREANERAFKRAAQGNRVLHLATHGFFLGSTCSPAAGGTRSVGGLSKSDNSRSNAGLNENPLLLSGLALAGANRRAAAGPDDDDGILTAEEVAGLNLSGVEWAVLSACDTGLGALKTGEGVFGLRRAFQLAGAQTVIMSLWQVDDEATRNWMRALYAGRQQKKLTTVDAVQEASLRMLRARRASGESTHPFYWGGFVAAGDWR
jgi:CHAT domain-containing protein/tetratricopeptide (TPR) repeat protein